MTREERITSLGQTNTNYVNLTDLRIKIYKADSYIVN